QLSRSADQRPCTGRVPAPCRRPLAAHAAASQPQGLHHVGTDDAAGGGLAPETDHPSSLAELSLRRHTPKMGAVCGKAARTVLCGGRGMKRPSLPLQRRGFITVLGGAVAAWPLAARAQPMPVIGFLSAYPQDSFAQHILAAFHRGLEELGYFEGRNVAIEYRWSADEYGRLPALAADLVQRGVSVIVASTSPAVPVAKAASNTIPIVFSMGGDPVALGYVASLSKPGGNLTGVTTLNVELGPKRLELMHELIPTTTVLGLLVNPT